jgi:AcrR family transcriptional regulator
MTKSVKSKQTPASKKRKNSKPTFTEIARRKQILEVSAKMFIQRGFDKTSLDEIAKKVGVSRGVIFYYFDGKREIGKETVLAGLRQYSEYVLARVDKKRTSKTQLLEFIDACLDYQSLNRETYLLYIDLIGCFGDAHDKYSLTVSMNRRTRELLVNIIEAGQAKGEIAKVSSHDLADIIQGFVDGLMEMCALDPDSVNIKGCKKLIRKMMLNTIEV